MAPLARMMLVLGGPGVFFLKTPGELLMAAAVIAVSYLLLGKPRALGTFVFATSPFALFTALLWLAVALDLESWNWRESAEALLATNSNYLAFLRMLGASSVLFLAFATIPDGQMFYALRAMGISSGIALIFASGSAFITSVRGAFLRSHTSLRAQGFIAPNAGSNLRHLPRVLAMTWVAGLDEALRRSEVKWDKNGFLADLQQTSHGGGPRHLWPSLVGLLTGATLLALGLRSILHAYNLI